MKKRFALFAAALSLVGCAALLNSDRPKYTGRIAVPAWHNASVKIEQQPVIHDGIVYAVGRAFGGPDAARVYGFDLHNGTALWSANFTAKKFLAAAGSTLFVADDGGQMHSLDAKTGKETAPVEAAFSSAIGVNGVLYTVAQNAVQARRGTVLWSAPIPQHEGAKLCAAGGDVYAYGYTESDFSARTPGLSGVYALNAGDGTLRWKWEVASKTDTLMLEGLSADRDGAYVWMMDKSIGSFGGNVLVALNASTGKEKWRRSTSMWVNLLEAPPLLDPHVVLIFDYPPGKDATSYDTGFLTQALDRATGEKLWESRTPWKYQEPGVFDGRLFVSDKQVHQVLDENNDVSPDSWVSAVDPRTGKEVWRSQTLELSVLTRTAAGGGMVVVGSKPFVWDSGKISGKNEVAGLWAWGML